MFTVFGDFKQKISLFKSAADGNRKIGFLRRVFGCRHTNMSRPFTYENYSYRACLVCGARRDFDTETLQTYGDFYHPPNPQSAFKTQNSGKFWLTEWSGRDVLCAPITGAGCRLRNFPPEQSRRIDGNPPNRQRRSGFPLPLVCFCFDRWF